MDLLNMNFSVSRIDVAVFLPKGKGTPVHKNRPTHGLALYVHCHSDYTFDTGEVIQARHGDMVYLPKNSNYVVAGRADEGFDAAGIYAINFDVIPGGESNRPAVIRGCNTEKMISLFSRAANAFRKKEIGYSEECFADLYGILKELRKREDNYLPKEKSRVLKPALDYINDNYTSEKISSEHLASLCGISQPYFRRLFAKAFSVSPAVYIRNLRIKLAKELLSSGEYTVTDVAMLSGFNEAAYFSREFKRAEGVSPKEYLESRMGAL